MLFSKLNGALFSRAWTIGSIGVRRISVTSKLSGLNDGKYKWKQQFQRLIGNREQVGYGWNGQPWYDDSAMFPFPAIRYKEPTPDLKALHEKEKGDWKELSIEEKKCLYRASFCQTFSEFQATTGHWKTIMGGVLVLISIGLWLNVFMYKFVYSQTPVPITFDEEHFRAQMRRQIDLHTNPVTGIAADWDYDKCEWKEPNKWRQLPNPFFDPCTGERVENNYRE